MKTDENRTDKTGSSQFVTVVVYVYMLAKFWYNFHPNRIKTGREINKTVKIAKVARQISKVYEI